MNFCSNCGHSISVLIPEDDNRERYCCGNCGAIHYVNPRIIVGTLPVWEDKLMICKRGIEPRVGLWTLPAGFMELGETTEEGAIRETWEETRAQVDIQHLHGVYNIPQIDQVYFIYLAQMRSPKFELTPESTQIELIDKVDIPWDKIAFPVIKQALTQYVEQGPAAFSEVHHSEILIPRFGERIKPKLF